METKTKTSMSVDLDTPTKRVVTVTSQTIPKDAEWHDRADMLALETTSEETWLKLNDEERQALCLIMGDILRRLADDPDVWLPISLVPRSGERMDVWIGLNMDVVDEEVVRSRRDSELEVLQAKKDLQLLEQELRAE